MIFILGFLKNNVDNSNHNECEWRQTKEHPQHSKNDNDWKKHDKHAKTKNHHYNCQDKNNRNQQRCKKDFHFFLSYLVTIESL